MRLPNLLATRNGRLAAFSLLYVTEGIPLGFAGTAVATQLRRQDVGPAEIGAFIGSFYLPWAFKWAFGPIIDVIGWKRLGKRRGWILITQVLLTLTLLSTVFLKLPQQLGLFTVILLVHNTFGAMQDVAIDALACNTLLEHERGLANGLMFAGASVGQLIGGAGVLFLAGYTGFQPTFFFVAGAITAVTFFVVLPMREPPEPAAPPVEGSRLKAAGRDIHRFALDSFRSFLGTRSAFAGLFFALLPPGAMCLGMALQSNLSVELGMSDDSIAWMTLWSSIITAVFCVIGGQLSDRVGRRKALFAYILMMGLPVLYMMIQLERAGWIMPVSPTDPNRPAVPGWLLNSFWVASLTYQAINGLMYGSRSAIFMDVTNPKVAATQFTAYMALLNAMIAYTSTWQGITIEAWGYPRTMLIDILFGLVGLIALPFMRKLGEEERSRADAGASGRARVLATALGILCAAWFPYRIWHDALGAGQAIAGTMFTLVFVASALFLFASGAMLRDSAPRMSKIATWIAPFVLLMYARYYVEPIAGAFGQVVSVDVARNALQFLLDVVPIVAAFVLLVLGRKPWAELRAVPAQ
ncbi:MAG: MFS transporter [Phycisphaerales bacterium]